MDYAQLFPNLLVGSHSKSTDDVDRLRAEFGITAVVNLQTDEDMRSRNIPWGLLEPHYRACGILLCRVPVRDEVPSLREKLPECVRALARLLDVREVVYLHCSFGAGRSPTVAIAYLHWCRGWDLDTALAFVQERHECSPSREAIQLARWGEQNT